MDDMEINQYAKMPGTELMRKFVELTKEKRKCDALEKGIAAELEAMQPFIQNYMDENGIDKQTVDGMTLYPQEQFSITTNEDTRVALMEYITKMALKDEICRDLERMMNLNSRSLTAYFKEKFKLLVMENPNAQIEDLFPDDMKAALKASSKIKIMARAVSK